MKKVIIIICAFTSIITYLKGQSTTKKVLKNSPEELSIEKVIHAVRIGAEYKIEIDGNLSEAIWNEAKAVSQFITWAPTLLWNQIIRLKSKYSMMTMHAT
ncbi:MAG: hypothetical protein ACI9FN_001787 [Saprospiraceae bacterium]|jgi:hypothetical protein